MSQQAAVAFFEKVRNDKGLLGQVRAKAEKRDAKGVAEIGKASGFDITASDVLAVAKSSTASVPEAEGEIDTQLLKNVVGGASNVNAVTSLFSCKKDSGWVCTLTTECGC
jgi:predicted ribosomally synthesized peptide with nif11-like leader